MLVNYYLMTDQIENKFKPNKRWNKRDAVHINWVRHSVWVEWVNPKNKNKLNGIYIDIGR